MSLVVMVVGLAMMGSFGGKQYFGRMPGFSAFWLFMLLWVFIGLVGAASSFYNAFSRRGLSLYELEMGEGEEGAAFCPQCGKTVGEGDRFCRDCGASVE